MVEVIRGVNLFGESYHAPVEKPGESLRLDEPMRVRLRLLPWRREGGSVVTPLLLECEVPNKKTALESIGTRHVSWIGPLSVRCRIEEENEDGARGTLLEITPGLTRTARSPAPRMPRSGPGSEPMSEGRHGTPGWPTLPS